MLPVALSIRRRRRILARELNRAAQDYRGCAAVSVACGHLREAEISERVRSASFSRLVGIDQDEKSLAVAGRALSRYGFEPQQAGVKSLVSSPDRWRREFDFIYASDLYDHLSDRFAKRLTARLFEMLRPGGRLLVANFLPGVPDAGYLESAMDWWLMYRSLSEISDLVEACPLDQMGAVRVYREPGLNIGFLEVFRSS